jgi:hypothetical protein
LEIPPQDKPSQFALRSAQKRENWLWVKEIRMKTIIALLVLFLSSPVFGDSITNFVGEYNLDLERSRGLGGHPNILKGIRLAIRADASVGWGGGKWHELKMVKDFDEKGIAAYIESYEIEGKKYEKNYSLKLHADGYIEINNGTFFKVKKDFTQPTSEVPTHHDVPMGLLGHPLGTALTIEGTQKAARGKFSQVLVVDSVNGQKLAKPVDILIQNAKRPWRSAQTRCVFNGYETGSMVGTPPALLKEGAKQNMADQVDWTFLRQFMIISVVEPASMEIE